VQVLLLILVAAVMLPETGESPVGDVASIAIVLGTTAFIVLAGAVHAMVLRRGLDGPGGLRRLERANRTMRWMQRAAVFTVVGGLVGLGLRASVRRFVGDPPLLDEALSLAPALVAITLAWWIFHPFEQRSRESMLLRRLDEGLPVQAPPARAAWVAIQVRSQLLVLLMPFALLLLGGESMRLVVGGIDDAPDWMAIAGSGVVFLLVALLAPAMVVRLVGARPLPPGEVREALESMCRTTGVRVRDLLIWPTGGIVVNAGVTGLVAPLRWVMLTDGLLETLERRQVLAVMAHELGHVRRHHMPWMGLSIVALAIGLGAALDPVAAAVREWRWSLGGDLDAAMRDLDRIELATIGLVLLGVLVGFGWVSRRFERQADAFAAASMSELEAGTSAEAVIGTEDVTPTGVEAMSTALSAVADANGVAVEKFTWRHGSIASRRRHLRTLCGVPRKSMPIDRVVRVIKVASVIVILAALGWWWTMPTDPASVASTRPAPTEVAR
jgi:Zn-dependent protease with chaperone function